MVGDYNDDIHEYQVTACLDRAGLKYRNGQRYIITQCPMHEDTNPSTQIFKNDWFVNCLAGCGRFHITKPFPELRSEPRTHTYNERKSKSEVTVHQNNYKTFNLYEKWKVMPLIPRDHQFKNLPLDVLDTLGWRWDNNSYFIPYFNETETAIPFAQWRHLSGDRRFTFLKDAKPTVYGKQNLIGNPVVFICEGASDMATLYHCAVPAVAMPSASSGTLLQKVGEYCKQSGIKLVYAGDNDQAGDKLLESLDNTCDYRVLKPPKKYKDWSDFYQAEGMDAVSDYCMPEMFESMPTGLTKPTVVDAVMKLFPGAVLIR